MQEDSAGSRFLLPVPPQCTPVWAQIGHLALGDSRSPKWPQHLICWTPNHQLIYGCINHWGSEGVCAVLLKELQRWDTTPSPCCLHEGSMSMFPLLHTPGHGSCIWGKLWALLQLKPQLQTQQQTWTWPNTCPAPLWDCLGAEGTKHSGTCQGALGIP